MQDKSWLGGMRGAFYGGWGQLLKFNVVGLLNTAIDFAIFYVLLVVGVPVLITQILSYSAGMLNSYFMNKHFTFRPGVRAIGGADPFQSRKSTPKQRKQRGMTIHSMAKFALLNGVVLGLSILLLFVCTELFKREPDVSKIAVTVVTMAVNFYGSRKWVFAKPVVPQGEREVG